MTLKYLRCILSRLLASTVIALVAPLGLRRGRTGQHSCMRYRRWVSNGQLPQSGGRYHPHLAIAGVPNVRSG